MKMPRAIPWLIRHQCISSIISVVVCISTIISVPGASGYGCDSESGVLSTAYNRTLLGSRDCWHHDRHRQVASAAESEEWPGLWVIPSLMMV